LEKTNCTFYRDGECRFGGKCRNIHDQEAAIPMLARRSTLADMLFAQSSISNTASPFISRRGTFLTPETNKLLLDEEELLSILARSLLARKQSSSANSLASLESSPAPSARNSISAPSMASLKESSVASHGKSTSDCKHWLSGLDCRYGDECLFQHRLEKKGTEPDAIKGLPNNGIPYKECGMMPPPKVRSASVNTVELSVEQKLAALATLRLNGSSPSQLMKKADFSDNWRSRSSTARSASPPGFESHSTPALVARDLLSSNNSSSNNSPMLAPRPLRPATGQVNTLLEAEKDKTEVVIYNQDAVLRMMQNRTPIQYARKESVGAKWGAVMEVLERRGL